MKIFFSKFDNDCLIAVVKKRFSKIWKNTGLTNKANPINPTKMTPGWQPMLKKLNVRKTPLSEWLGCQRNSARRG